MDTLIIAIFPLLFPLFFYFPERLKRIAKFLKSAQAK